MRVRRIPVDHALGESHERARRRVVLLDQFGSVQFTNAPTVVNGPTVTLATAGAMPVTMTNNAGKQLATPSALGADGASFRVGRG